LSTLSFLLVDRLNTLPDRVVTVMETQPRIPVQIAMHVWDGRINGRLADFDEYTAVMSEISDSVECAL